MPRKKLCSVKKNVPLSFVRDPSSACKCTCTLIPKPKKKSRKPKSLSCTCKIVKKYPTPRPRIETPCAPLISSFSSLRSSCPPYSRKSRSSQRRSPFNDLSSKCTSISKISKSSTGLESEIRALCQEDSDDEDTSDVPCVCASVTSVCPPPCVPFCVCASCRPCSPPCPPPRKPRRKRSSSPPCPKVCIIPQCQCKCKSPKSPKPKPKPRKCCIPVCRIPEEPAPRRRCSSLLKMLDRKIQEMERKCEAAQRACCSPNIPRRRMPASKPRSTSAPAPCTCCCVSCPSGYKPCVCCPKPCPKKSPKPKRSPPRCCCYLCCPKTPPPPSCSPSRPAKKPQSALFACCKIPEQKPRSCPFLAKACSPPCIQYCCTPKCKVIADSSQHSESCAPYKSDYMSKDGAFSRLPIPGASGGRQNRLDELVAKYCYGCDSTPPTSRDSKLNYCFECEPISMTRVKRACPSRVCAFGNMGYNNAADQSYNNPGTLTASQGFGSAKCLEDRDPSSLGAGPRRTSTGADGGGPRSAFRSDLSYLNPPWMQMSVPSGPHTRDRNNGSGGNDWSLSDSTTRTTKFSVPTRPSNKCTGTKAGLGYLSSPSVALSREQYPNCSRSREVDSDYSSLSNCYSSSRQRTTERFVKEAIQDSLGSSKWDISLSKPAKAWQEKYRLSQESDCGTTDSFSFRDRKAATAMPGGYLGRDTACSKVTCGPTGFGVSHTVDTVRSSSGMTTSDTGGAQSIRDIDQFVLGERSRLNDVMAAIDRANSKSC